MCLSYNFAPNLLMYSLQQHQSQAPQARPVQEALHHQALRAAPQVHLLRGVLQAALLLQEVPRLLAVLVRPVAAAQEALVAPLHLAGVRLHQAQAPARAPHLRRVQAVHRHQVAPLLALLLGAVLLAAAVAAVPHPAEAVVHRPVPADQALLARRAVLLHQALVAALAVAPPQAAGLQARPLHRASKAVPAAHGAVVLAAVAQAVVPAVPVHVQAPAVPVLLQVAEAPVPHHQAGVHPQVAVQPAKTLFQHSLYWESANVPWA